MQNQFWEILHNYQKSFYHFVKTKKISILLDKEDKLW